MTIHWNAGEQYFGPVFFSFISSSFTQFVILELSILDLALSGLKGLKHVSKTDLVVVTMFKMGIMTD